MVQQVGYNGVIGRGYNDAAGEGYNGAAGGL